MIPIQLGDFIYLVTPFATWFITGCTKFLVNSMRSQNTAFAHIGYGGFPSNHSAIVSSMAMLIALREGITHPAFGVAITLAFIVMMDANSLRLKIGEHATRINQLDAQATPLRERMGHSKFEILGGVAMGILCAYCIHYVFKFWA